MVIIYNTVKWWMRVGVTGSESKKLVGDGDILDSSGARPLFVAGAIDWSRIGRAQREGWTASDARDAALRCGRIFKLQAVVPDKAASRRRG